MLQGVVREVVEFAFAGFVHRARQCSGAHPVISTDRAQVHNLAE